MGVGGLSDRVGQGGNLGDDLSDSKSLSGGVGKVAYQSVVLNGVMSRGTDKVGGCIAHNSDSWGHSHCASTGKVMREEKSRKVFMVVVVDAAGSQAMCPAEGPAVGTRVLAPTGVEAGRRDKMFSIQYF